MTGSNKRDWSNLIIKAVSLAVKDIDNNLIEIYPKIQLLDPIKL